MIVMVFVLILTSPLLSCSLLEEIDDNTPISEVDDLALSQNTAVVFSNPNCPMLEGDTNYRLGPDDKIEILVYNEQNLSNTYTLPKSGVINLPLIGETMLGGCSAQQVEQLLYQQYTNGYLVNPGISVAISDYRPFYILGEVQQPGQYDYVEDMNALQAVAIAGGFTYRADKNKAKILTGRYDNQPVYKQMRIENAIKPGDVIVIQERLF